MTISTEDAAYFSSRAGEEEQAADQAQSQEARQAHLRLASAYHRAAVGCARLEAVPRLDESGSSAESS